jgi:hypothetical protein
VYALLLVAGRTRGPALMARQVSSPRIGSDLLFANSREAADSADRAAMPAFRVRRRPGDLLDLREAASA